MSSNLHSPIELFYKWEASQPDKVFLNQPIDGKYHTYTWKEAGDQIRRMAAALQAMGLKESSCIGLVSKNCAHWIMADLAILMAGHISVPIYPNVGPFTMRYILEHCEASVLFVGKLDEWERMEPGVPEGVTQIAFPDYGPKGDQYTDWQTTCEKHEPMKGKPVPDPAKVMTIIYTSGTTGSPKGVVQTHGALAYAVEHAISMVDVGGTKARFFSYLPLAHIAERILVELGGLNSGGEMFFAHSLDTFAKNLQTASPTIFLGVPRIWTKFMMAILEKMPASRLNLILSIPVLSYLLKRKVKSGLGFSKTNHFLTGAAPTPPAIMNFFKKMGIPLQEVYGMTENCAYSHFNRKDNMRIGYAGQPLPEVEVKISEEGEILVKNKCTMMGYYKEPELTAAALTDGFLHTGDQGFEEEDGWLKITGRVKDIFKTSKGKYVSPSPIELEIAKNKLIEQVCVVGTGIPQPIALLVLSEEGKQLNEEEIEQSLSATLKRVNNQLEKHEVMKKGVVMKEEWTIENEILTPTMKIKRNEIDKRYKDRYPEWYEAEGLVVWE